jgi:tetratricopeptide (TPR) repeat protein
MIYNGRGRLRERGVTDHDSDDSDKAVLATVEESAHSVTISAGAAGTEPPLEVAPARELDGGALLAGRYEIEATLGRGGSGTVYRAWDRVLGEPIAMKILRPDRARERSWIKRLAREVKVARAIRHPNVCRVFELGHADGQWFVTMELATGGTLRDLLDAGGSATRPLGDRLADARAICAGLSAIHAVGIFHRDVTPQNVLRMADGRLLMSDFGLAIQLLASTTVHGGTPNYMPPETLLGQRGDQRSDVWQLGVILHELFFGSRPTFAQDGNRATMTWPLPFGAAPVEEELGRLITDCLAGNPAGRPPTAMVVAGRLAAAEQARPRWMLERLGARAKRSLSRHRLLAAAVLILAACGGLVRALQVAERPRLCRAAGDRVAGVWDPGVKREVRQAFDRSGRAYAPETFSGVDRLLSDYLGRWRGMYTEACEATNVRGEQSAEVLDLRMACLRDRLDGVRALTSLFAHADGDVVDNAASATSALGTLELCADPKLLRNVLPLPEGDDAREEVARLRPGIAEAKALHDAGNEALAAGHARALVSQARRVHYPPVLAEALLLLGEIEVDAGRNEASHAAIKEAAWLAEASRADEVEAEAVVYLVWTSGALGRYEEADDWAGQADAVLERIGGHTRLRGWLETHVATNRKAQGRYAEALEHEQQAAELKQRAGAGGGDLARSLNNQADVLVLMGRNQEAIGYFDQAIAQLGDEVGAGHPLVATFISNKGESLDRLGRHEEARAAYHRALASEERAYGPESTVVAYPLAGLGESYLAEHRPGAAVAPLERAWRIRDGHENNAALVAETSFALGQALWGSGGDRQRALRLAAGAEKVYAARPGFAAQAAEVARWLGARNPG